MKLSDLFRLFWLNKWNAPKANVPSDVRGYLWNVDSLHEQSNPKRCTPIDYNGIKKIIDELKPMIRKETNKDVKEDLVFVAMKLNNLMLKK